MNWVWLVSYFFGGVFAANAIPHFVAGTMGRPFQSPFGNPTPLRVIYPRMSVVKGVYPFTST